MNTHSHCAWTNKGDHVSGTVELVPVPPAITHDSQGLGVSEHLDSAASEASPKWLNMMVEVTKERLQRQFKAKRTLPAHCRRSNPVCPEIR
jgi:hypothetical protein